MVAKTKSSVFSREEAVARVAYKCSDVVVTVQPNLTDSGSFSPTLDHLYSGKIQSLLGGQVCQVIPVRTNADPFGTVLRYTQKDRVVSVATHSKPLLFGIPHIYKLSSYPVVIHVMLSNNDDLSTIAALRHTGLMILHSASLQEAQDLALVSHALALSSGKGVIHFWENDQNDLPIPSEANNVIKVMLASTERGQEPDGTDSGLESRYLQKDKAPAAPHDINTRISGGEIVNGEVNGINGNHATQHITDPPEANPIALDDLFNLFENITGRKYTAFEYLGSSSATDAIVTWTSFSKSFQDVLSTSPELTEIGIVNVRLYRPWSTTSFLKCFPPTVKRIAVVEELTSRPLKWGPMFIDVLSATQERAAVDFHVTSYQIGHVRMDTMPAILGGIISNMRSETPQKVMVIGESSTTGSESSLAQPQLENAYVKILQQLFGKKLNVLNPAYTSDVTIADELQSAPEYALGSFFARVDRQKSLFTEVSIATRARRLEPSTLNDLLAQWISEKEDHAVSDDLADGVLDQLRKSHHPLCKKLLSDPWLIKGEIPWIIGSEAWAYDLGSSAVHHALASGRNVNLLVIDSEPYSSKSRQVSENRKKDIGLYAMNFGNAYVASVAVYSSYTQVMHAMLEAEQYDGPSIVLAYLPYSTELESPLQMMQDTKMAVDSGYWPLYRWTPSLSSIVPPSFHLDSERVKKELKAFIDRENHLTHLTRDEVQLSPIVSHSYGTEMRLLRKRKAKEAIESLMEGLSGPPITVLFASDGGNAENVAKRLARRGKARGLKPKLIAMDDFPMEDLPSENNVIFCISTAGQGEFPQNGREMWDALKSGTDIDLSKMNFSVFGLGDSHYWPRKEDRIYFNKPAKDLDARLADLGATRMTDIGLGDDQDPDGYETGYNIWEPLVWKALGVDQVEADVDEPKPLTNEDIKIASNFLRGTIAEGLADTSTGAISESDAQLTKFHGTYMQDDRDLRDERKSQGLEPAYSFMVRVRMSGGVCQPGQWIAMDEISDKWGNETFKMTTRQTFQFHGILKKNLRTAIRSINLALLTTIGACGDVNRNVMCSSAPSQSGLHAEVYQAAKSISDRLLPSTSAYHEIWLQDNEGKKTQVGGDAVQDFEPLYGPTYLPRKFKVTIAVPPVNDTDVYAHDIGLIAIKNEGSVLLDGFNVLVGGGMGMTHGSKKTYARLGQLLGFCKANQVSEVAEAVMLVQRDNGDRTNRKHARLKYTIDDMGLDEFKRQVEERLGWRLEAPRSHEPFTKNIDDFSGWVQGDDGLFSHTVFIENGRVENRPELAAKAGLLEIAKYMLQTGSGHFRLTGNQHVIIAGITSQQLPHIKEVLAKYTLDNLNFSGLRLSSSACVAFPTCGLAMAESERYLPTLITKLEDVIVETGLRNTSIVMRMTGCPNGCARPWVAEIACVGKAPGTYNLMLGGGYYGQRLNKLYRASVKEDEILETLKPMIKRYALERNDGEHFGDWVIRAGYITAVERGGQHGAMHEGVPEED